jgi:hypothetical protein
MALFTSASLRTSQSGYGVHRLVWFECHEEHASALQREKRIKEWERDWKINLIERDNPHWLDLAPPFEADPHAVGGMGPGLRRDGLSDRLKLT